MIVRILSVSVRVGVFDPKGHGEVFFLDSQTIVLLSDFGLSGSSLPYVKWMCLTCSTDFRLPNDCDTKYPPSRSKSCAAPVGVPGNLESSLYSTVRRMNPCRRNKKMVPRRRVYRERRAECGV